MRLTEHILTCDKCNAAEGTLEIRDYCPVGRALKMAESKRRRKAEARKVLAQKGGLVLIGLLALAVGVEAQRVKSAYKLTHLSTEAAAVACLDGGDPDVQRLGNVLIVTCKPILVSRNR
jgi:hypothetical protein